MCIYIYICVYVRVRVVARASQAASPVLRKACSFKPYDLESLNRNSSTNLGAIRYFKPHPKKERAGGPIPS